MYDQNVDVSKGWDAREHFVRELVFRLNKVGMSNEQNLQGWLENVSDFLDMACVYFQDKIEGEDGFRARLEKITDLIYSNKKKKNGEYVYLTENERAKNKQDAYKQLRLVFREMHILAYNHGAYMPIKKARDPNRAIASYYDKK